MPISYENHPTMPNPRGIDSIVITNKVNSRAGYNPMEGLQIGRNVHYVVAEGEHRVAFISKIWNDDGVVNLSYVNDWSYDLQFGNQPLIPATSVRYSENHEQHTWHWIERA